MMGLSGRFYSKAKVGNDSLLCVDIESVALPDEHIGTKVWQNARSKNARCLLSTFTQLREIVCFKF